MMATNTSSVICVLLCVVCLASSVKIRGTIKKNSIENATEVELSEYIDGYNYENTTSLTLDGLVDGQTLLTLTLTNFKSIRSLEITNIPIGQVPVFENISATYITITETKIKYVQSNAFNGAEVGDLFLDRNEIQKMSARSINMEVTRLGLSCNEISEFSHTWFKDPSRVRDLLLAGNRIEYIQDYEFHQMTQLEVLYLNNNHIRRIGSEAFGSRIINLHLHFNNIELLMPDMFADRDKRIDALLLHHNQLSFLSEALLVKLKIKRISLDGNPWQCQCLRDIERWIREQNITRYYMRDRRSEPVCVVPLNFQNVCVQTVDKELQQTYAKGLSSVQDYLPTECGQDWIFMFAPFLEYLIKS